MEFTLKDFILRFGTEKQINSFKESGMKNINKRVLDSICKEAKRFYESIIITGRGSDRIITCSEEIEIPLHKVDKRMKNGAWSNKYTINLDIVVANQLNLISNKALFIPQTMKKWAMSFNIITQKEYILLNSKYHVDDYYNEVNEAIEANIIKKGTEKILLDYSVTLQNTVSEFASSLSRMQKANIIHLETYYMGHKPKTNDVINISESEFNQVEKLENNYITNTI